MKHEKARKCGKDSLVPVIMAMDSLAAGSDTTGFIHKIFLDALPSLKTMLDIK